MNESELRAMIAADERHWWYRGRRRILASVLGSLTLPPRPTILDVGCGSGRTLDDLSRLGEARGVEVDEVEAAAARDRGHEVEHARAEDLPFPSSTFDLVTCLDVLEHTPNDVVTLRELGRVLRPAGYLVLTVPAYPALWSVHDEVNRHYRRYRRSDLRHAAERAGLRPVRNTSFNLLLLPAAATVRIARRGATVNARSKLGMTPGGLNRVLELPLRLEAAIIGRGVDLPAGLLHLAVLEAQERRAAVRSVARAG